MRIRDYFLTCLRELAKNGGLENKLFRGTN